MIAASVWSPRKNDNAAVTTSSPRRPLRSWRARTDHALTPCTAMTFGPNVTRRTVTSPDVRPSGREALAP